MKRLIVSLFLMVLVAAITACSGGKGSVAEKTIEGYAQKGPFVEGELEVYDLNKNLLGKTTINKEGYYKIKAPYKEIYILKAKGKFFDEIKGKVSDERVELNALAKDEKVNLNILTTFEAKRALKLLEKEEDINKALNLVKKELKDIFGIDERVDLTKLDIKNTEDKNSLELLVISSAFSKYASDNNESVSKLIEKNSEGYANQNKFDVSFNNIAKLALDNTKTLLDSAEKNLGIKIKNKDSKPNWADSFIHGIEINSVALESVILNDKKLSYSNQNIMPIGLKGEDSYISIIAHFSKSSATLNDSAKVYLDIDNNQTALNIEEKDIIDLQKQDYQKTIKVKLSSKVKNLLQNAYLNNKSVKFIVQIGSQYKDLTAIPKLITISEKLTKDINIKNLTYISQCANKNANFMQVNMGAKLFNANVDFNNSCIELTYNSQNYEYDVKLDSGEGSVKDIVNYNIAGVTLDINVNKVDKNGVVIDSIKLNLPKDHTIHEWDINNSNQNIGNIYYYHDFDYINPNGKEYLELAGGAVSNISDINLTLSISSLNKKYYMHIKELPFYIFLDSVKITKNGIEFTNSYIKYLFDFDSQNDFANAAVRFSNPKSKSYSFYLGKDGVTFKQNLEFKGLAEVKAPFPYLEISSNGFTVELNNSKLENFQSAADNKIELVYLDSCQDSTCNNGFSKTRLSLSQFNQTKIFSNGASIVKYSNKLPSIEWGTSVNGTVFKRANDEGALVYIPGFTVNTKNPKEIINYLLGSAWDNNSNLREYPIDSQEVKKGRYLFAGINVGKVVVDVENSGSEGESLNNKDMLIRFENNHTLTIRSNAYSKYYIRNSGVTGVFNRDNSSGINTTIYGYQTSFSKFAFRQVNNKIDDFTWIDGEVKVPGKGDFKVVFNSMALKCDGSVTGARVIPCSSGGVNCNESLKAWSVATLFNSLEFKGESQCNVNKKLRIGHILDIKALKNKIALNTTWTATGIPVDSKIKNGAVNQVDGDPSKNNLSNNGGYDILLEKITLASNSSQDWIEANATVGLPFWNSLEASMILKNRSKTSKDYTIIVQKGDLSKLDLTKSNQSIYRDIKKDYNATISYKWGGLIEFNMPAYYDSSKKEFKGRVENHLDLSFAKLSSAISMIDPEKTSIKFGASANLVEFGKLNLHVDLNDPESLKEIDKTLVEDLKIFSRNSDGEGPFEATLGKVLENINIANKFLKSGFDITLEELAVKGLNEASDALGDNDPFKKVSNLLSEAKSTPSLIYDRVDKEVKEAIIGNLNKGFDELDRVFKNATAGMTYQAFAQANDATFKSILKVLSIVDDAVKEYEKVVAFVEDVNKTVNEIDKVTQYANDLYNQVVSYLKPIDKNSSQKCSFTYTANHGVFKPVGDVTKKVKDVNSEIQKIKLSNIKNIVKNIKKFTGVDTSFILPTINKVQKLANSINKTINEQDGFIHKNFNKYICQNKDIENLLTEITDKIKLVDTIKGKLNTILNDIHKELEKKGEVGKHIYAVYGFTSKVKNKINSLYTNKHNIAEDALTKFAREIMEEKSVKEFFKESNETNASNLEGIDIFRVAVNNKVEKLLDKHFFKKAKELSKEIEKTIPTYSDNDIREYVVEKFFDLPAIKGLSDSIEKFVKPVADEVQKVALSIFGGFEKALNKTLAKISDKINKALKEAQAPFKDDLPLKSFEIDGFAVIRGDMLHQLHIQSDFRLQKKKKDETFSFVAALDMWRITSESSGGCAGKDFKGGYNIQISARDIDMPIGLKEMKVDLIMAGVTIQDNGLPIGVFGAVVSKKGMDFKKFALYNMGLALGIGKLESYLGAKAKAKVDNIQLGVSFLVGLVCNKDIQSNFIPEVIYTFMTIPNNKFRGALVYGEAQIPAWNNGCMLTIVARAKVGAWILLPVNKSFIAGGLFGGALFGKGVCIATLGGELMLKAEYSGGNVRFEGDGWGAAGVGMCDDSWDSVKTSRADDWCGTGDAQFKARFDKSVKILKVDFSAIH